MAKYSQEKQDARTSPAARTALDVKPPELAITAARGDHFEQQGMDSGLLNSIQSLKTISGAVGSYSTMQESNKADNIAQAKADQLRDSQLPEDDYSASDATEAQFGFLNQGSGYRQAYDAADGQATVSEWSKSWLELLEEKKNFTEETDPKKAYDEAFQAHYANFFDESRTSNPTIMSEASSLYYATKSSTDAGFALAVNKKMEATFHTNIKKFQATDLEIEVNKPDFDPKKVKSLYDHDYVARLKGMADTEGVTLDRNAYTAGVVDNVRSVAMRLAGDRGTAEKPVSTMDAYSKAARALSVLETSGSDGISYRDAKDVNGSPIFRASIDEAKAEIASIYKVRHLEDEETLKKVNLAWGDKFTYEVVLDDKIPMSEVTAQLAKANIGIDKDKLRAAALKFRQGDEGVNENKTKIVDLDFKIETATSVEALEKLKYVVRDEAAGNYMYRQDAKGYLNRITSLQHYLKTANQGERGLKLQELKFADDNLRSTYAPIINAADEYGGGKSARVDEYNSARQKLYSAFKAGKGDLLAVSEKLATDAQAGRIKEDKRYEVRPELPKAPVELKKVLQEKRISQDAFNYQMKALIEQEKARQKKLQGVTK